MNKEERLKEQRRKAQKKYWESHRDYYHKQSLNEAKRVRIERKTYKQALQDIKEYVEELETEEYGSQFYSIGSGEQVYILNIINEALGSDKE